MEIARFFAVVQDDLLIKITEVVKHGAKISFPFR
jgi:hypothetical protein